MPKTTYNSQMFYVYLDSSKVWEYIEMGRNVDELYPPHFNTENLGLQYSSSLSEKMMEGEEFVLLEGWQFDYAVTSLGRAFNIKSQKQLRGYLKNTTSDIVFTLRNKKIFIKDVFSEQNWIYDSKVIHNTYIQNKWEIQLAHKSGI